MQTKLCRRDFIKNGIVAVSGIYMSTLLSSCATTFETHEDVINIQWDSNPDIPIPQNGCYVGWHRDLFKHIRTPWGKKYTQENIGKQSIDNVFDGYNQSYGYKPAVYSFSDRSIKDEWFPDRICNAIIDNGTIPLIRYYYSWDFEKVGQGKLDSHLIEFAQSARKFGKPFFFIPYPEVNIGRAYKYVHPWAGGSGKQFKKAWKHMHHVFEEEGANEYAVWGLHLLGFGSKQPFSHFEIDDNLVDWIGFTVYEFSFHSESFKRKFNRAYYWAADRYHKKPLALWEFGISSKLNQEKRIDIAYESLKNMPRVKSVVYAEYDTSKGFEETFISDKAKPQFRQSISDPYFIKN